MGFRVLWSLLLCNMSLGTMHAGVIRSWSHFVTICSESGPVHLSALAGLINLDQAPPPFHTHTQLVQ